MSGAFLGIEPATSRTPTPYVSPLEPTGKSGFGDLMKGLLKPDQPQPKPSAKRPDPDAAGKEPVQEKAARSPVKPVAAKKPARKNAAPETEEQPAPSEGEEVAVEGMELPAEEQPVVTEELPVPKLEAEVPVDLVLSQMTETVDLPAEPLAPLPFSGPVLTLPAEPPSSEAPDEVSLEEVPLDAIEQPILLDEETVSAPDVETKGAAEAKPQPVVETNVAADAKPQPAPVLRSPTPVRAEEGPAPAADRATPVQRVEAPAPAPEDSVPPPAVQNPVAPAPEMIRERPVERAPVEAEVEEAVPVMTEAQAVEPVPVKAEASAVAAQPAAPSPQKTVSTPAQDSARPAPSPAPEAPALNLPAGATLLKTPVESLAARESSAKTEVASAAVATKNSGANQSAAPAEELMANVPVAAESEATMDFSSDDPTGRQTTGFGEENPAAPMPAPRTMASPLVNEAVSFRAAQAAAVHAAAPAAPGTGVPGQALGQVERLHELVERFDEHVMSLASGKDKTMSITLVPETLGKVVLNCREHGGQMSVEIVAESQVVRSLIQQQESSVRHLLEQSGYKMDSFDVRTQDGQGDRRPGQQEARDGEATPAAFRNASRTQGAGHSEAARPASWKPAGNGGLWVVA